MLQRLGLAVVTMAVIVGCNSAPPSSDTPSSDSDSAASGSGDDSGSGYYTIADYDPEADAAADLAETVTRAESESKRIILISGGDW